MYYVQKRTTRWYMHSTGWFTVMLFRQRDRAIIYMERQQGTDWRAWNEVTGDVIGKGQA